MENNMEEKTKENTKEKTEEKTEKNTEETIRDITQWKHKESGKIYRVLPWWECHGTVIDKPESILEDKEDEWKDRQYRIGILAQVGWLLENDNGLWLGVGPQAREAFEDYTEQNV